MPDNERRFHSEFHSRDMRSEISIQAYIISKSTFRMECSIRNEKMNKLDPNSCKHPLNLWIWR